MCDMSATHALIMLRGMRLSRYAARAHHLTRHSSSPDETFRDCHCEVPSPHRRKAAIRMQK